jgi:hypothetical protein
MDALFTGRLGSFYADNILIVPANPLFHGGGALYGMPLYLVMGIWNLPLYLLDKLGVDPLVHTLLLHWSKLQLIVALMLTLYYMRRIALLIGMDRKATEWLLFLTASSCLVIGPLLVSTQYDILAVSIVMIALYNYFKGSIWGFLLWFALASAFKGFALIIFLPLLLLHEKRIPHILWKLILVVAPSFLLSMLFPIASGEQELVTRLYMRLFSWLIPTSASHSSVFLVASMILWVFCLYQKPLEGIRKYSIPLYACFAATGSFITIVFVNPYWVVLAAPFLYFTLFFSASRFRITVLLESVFTISMIILFQFRFYWCYNFRTIAPTLLSKILREMPESMLEYSPRFLMDRFISNATLTIGIYVIASAVFAGFVLLLWFLYPRQSEESLPTKDTITEQMPLLIGRTTVAVITCSLPVAIYLFWVLFY